MKQIVIFFVPIEATQQDFDDALRAYFGSMETGETRTQAARPKPVSRDELPLWTWFVPNPCH